jgi:4-hydroxybenzoyl-CoA reductase subunit beta
MLRLPRFALEVPETVGQALAALSTSEARLLAGGTDLLPNLKHRLETPSTLVSLHRLAALRGIALDEGARVLRLGTGVTLATIAHDATVKVHAPSLAEAAASVASPQIRNTATLGGNVHLDTRCRYVNQTALWRSAIGGCLKSGGTVCHVVEGGQNCVAALSSDTVPVLVALDAELVLASLVDGSEQRRSVPFARYFRSDGLRHTERARGELATEVRVPLATGPRRATYVKWRPRATIDFPLVSIALRFDLDGEHDEAVVTDARVVVGVLGSRPRVVSTAAAMGLRMRDETLPERVAEAVWRECKPLENVPYEAPYRRTLLRVLTRRAVARLAGVGAVGAT